MPQLTKLLTLTVLAINLSSLAAGQARDKVIMFDLHDVVLEFSTSQALSGFWRIPKKMQFLKSVHKYFTAKRNGQNIAIEKFALQNSSNPEYHASVLQTINPHEPNPAMVQLIKRLKANGVKVYICSNIGGQSYQELTKRYPNLFNQIDGCICSRAQDGYPKKDTPKFWNQIPALIPAEVSTITFVDDKQKNLDLARTMCPRIQGIVFQGPEQLEAKLLKMGLIK